MQELIGTLANVNPLNFSFMTVQNQLEFCPWQAFPAQLNVCGLAQEPNLERSLPPIIALLSLLGYRRQLCMCELSFRAKKMNCNLTSCTYGGSLGTAKNQLYLTWLPVLCINKIEITQDVSGLLALNLEQFKYYLNRHWQFLLLLFGH